MEWDWHMGCNTYKGRLTITRITPPTRTPDYTKEYSTDANGCKHENRYINEAGGVRFWVCPKCKKDLGNA